MRAILAATGDVYREFGGGCVFAVGESALLACFVRRCVAKLLKEPCTWQAVRTSTKFDRLQRTLTVARNA
jgi:hypothetical protein